MFEVILSTGDRAEADTPEDAVYAAEHLLVEAHRHGSYYAKPTAAFYGDGVLVRSGVTLADLPERNA